MNTILVTGANGQLGSAIQKTSIYYDRFKYCFYDLPEMDLTDFTQTEKLILEIRPSVIINCSAYTAVDNAENDQEKAFLINALAVRNLGEITQKNNIRYFHISTDYVFDGKKNTPYLEDDPTSPVSVYGSTKLQGEEYLKGMENTMIIRTSWLYSAAEGSFVNKIIHRSSQQSHLKVVYDQTGTPTYAPDLARALLEIATSCERDETAFNHGIFHYSNEGVTSWFDFAVEILKYYGRDTMVEPVESHEFPSPVKRPHYSVLSKQKIKDVYNITIPHWRESLGYCIMELKNN